MTSMVEFKSKPTRKAGGGDLGSLITQIKGRSGPPKKLNLTRRVITDKEPTPDMKCVEHKKD